MKVLEIGKWKIPWSMEVMCSEKEYGTNLLIEEGDVSAVYDSLPARYSLVCPVCGSCLYLPPASIPLRVKAEADKKKEWSYRD